MKSISSKGVLKFLISSDWGTCVHHSLLSVSPPASLEPCDTCPPPQPLNLSPSHPLTLSPFLSLTDSEKKGFKNYNYALANGSNGSPSRAARQLLEYCSEKVPQ